jgi:hypothetical protein
MLIKCDKADISTFGPLRPSPTQSGILLRSWLENRPREGFGRMSKCGGVVDGGCHGGCDGSGVDVRFGGYGAGG